MTKKSDARLARDAQEKMTKEKLKDNTCWKDLKDIHAACLSLLTQHTHIIGFSKDLNLVNEVVDKKSLIGLINTLSTDLFAMTTELDSMFKLHADKDGGSQNPDEVMYSIQLYEQYNLFMEKHEAVVMPTALQIGEHFSLAERALIRRKAGEMVQVETPVLSEEDQIELARQEEVTRQLAELADPNVTSDVVFVETPVGSEVKSVNTEQNVQG